MCSDRDQLLLGSWLRHCPSFMSFFYLARCLICRWGTTGLSSFFLSICVHVIALIHSRSDHPVVRCTPFFIFLPDVITKHMLRTGQKSFPTTSQSLSLFTSLIRMMFFCPSILTNNPSVNQTINKLPVQNVWECLFSRNMFYFLHPQAPK